MASLCCHQVQLSGTPCEILRTVGRREHRRYERPSCIETTLYRMVPAFLRVYKSYLCIVNALVHFPDKPEHEQLPVLARHVWKALFQCVLLVVPRIKNVRILAAEGAR